MDWGLHNPDGTLNYANQLYNWFREEPISTRATQFATGYTAAGRALEGNYLGAIGALRYWPKHRHTRGRYPTRRSRTYIRRQRYTRSRNTKRIRGLRTSKGYSRATSKGEKKRLKRKKNLKTIAYWTANKGKQPYKKPRRY